MDAWNAGVFSVMTIMVAIIGIIAATRFIYIDRQYMLIIRQGKKDLNDYIKRPGGDGVDAPAEEFIDAMIATSDGIGYARSGRENNRKEGMRIDFASMGAILALGIIASFGVFDGLMPFILLNLLLATLFIVPVAHFAKHATGVQGKASVDS